MKFTGKELFELGVPKNKIKFFVDREFSSKEELQAELAPKEAVEVQEKVFTWLDWILQSFPINHLPCGFNGDKPVPMSKSELKRLFDSKSIRVNGKFPTTKDECLDDDFPLFDLAFFPKSDKRRTTFIGYFDEFIELIKERHGMDIQEFLWWNKHKPELFPYNPDDNKRTIC